MKPGDRLAGRWEILAEAPGSGPVRRWRAAEVTTGAPVEVLELVRGGADARAAFRSTHEQLRRAGDPALAGTLALVDEQGVLAAVRPPLQDPTLADLPGPLEPGAVAYLGVRLVPAVIAAGGASAGLLRGTDVGLDADWQAVVAPRGQPTHRVDFALTGATAPEVFGGGRPGGAAGLYGLGALLYRLATGKAPATSGTDPSRPPPPPPSALQAGVPPELDEAILRLLSTDPGQRATALPLLQAAASAEPPDLQAAAVPPATGAVRVTVGGSAPVSRGRPAHAVGSAAVVPAAALARLDPAGRSAAAGYAEVPVARVDELARTGLPLVLETFAGRAAAVERAAQLERRLGLPVAAVAPPGLAPWVLGLGIAAAASVPLAALALVLAIGAVVWAVPAAIALAALFVAAAWVGVRWAQQRAGFSAARAAAAKLEDARAHASALQPAWKRAAEVRRALAEADLHEAGAADLRSALREVEVRLADLEAVDASIRQTLDKVRPAQLRTRMQALSARAGREPGLLPERDRLARTLADVEALEAQRTDLTEEARRVQDALAEVSAVLGRTAEADAPSPASPLAAPLAALRRSRRESEGPG